MACDDFCYFKQFYLKAKSSPIFRKIRFEIKYVNFIYLIHFISRQLDN